MLLTPPVNKSLPLWLLLWARLVAQASARGRVAQATARRRGFKGIALSSLGDV
jgi:hypothetical protein